MRRYPLVIFVISAILAAILVLGIETLDQDEGPQLASVNVGDEFERFQADLIRNDRVTISNAISGAASIQGRTEVQEIALAIWQRERGKYPSFAWRVLEEIDARILIAQLLLQIEKNGYRTDIDRQELLNFVRGHLYKSNEFSLHAVTWTLGTQGDETDVERLLRLARSKNSSAFENAVFGLSLMCFEAALTGLGELEKEMTNRIRIKMIAETRAEIIDNRQRRYLCRDEAEPPPLSAKPPQRELTRAATERIFEGQPKTIEEFKIALTDEKSISTKRILARSIKYFYSHIELPQIFVAIWKADREKYPSFAWNVLTNDLSRIEVADTLIGMVETRRVHSVAKTELLRFLRAQLKNPSVNAVNAAARVLSLEGDATDVERLKVLALSPHYGLFRAGASALGRMCSELAAEALDDVEKAISEPRRLNDISRFKERSLKLESEISRCKG